MADEVRSYQFRDRGEVGLSPPRVGHVKFRFRVFRATKLLALSMIGLIWCAGSETPQPARPSGLFRGELGGELTSFALSPGGTVATTDVSGRVELIPLDGAGRGIPPRWLPGYTRAVAFSSDGRLLACGGDESYLTLSELDSRVGTRIVPLPFDRVRAIVFSPDGRRLAASTLRDGTVIVWDLVAWRLMWILREEAPVHGLAISSDGLTLACAARPGHEPGTHFWDLRMGRRSGGIGGDESQYPLMFAYSPEGKRVAQVTLNHGLRVWESRPGGLFRETWQRRGVQWVAFYPNGKRIAVATIEGSILLCEAATGRQWGILQARLPSSHTVALAGDGRRLVGLAWAARVMEVWELDTTP